MSTGKLYICPTPIGNLEDITIRTLKTLNEVDLIAAEDTRHSLILLNHYEIKKPLTSYHEHNIREKGPKLIDMLLEGKNIALITDAGMPGISDPGEDLIRLAIEEEIEVIGLPGPTASITALVISGISTDKFVFEGFLSSKKKDRIKELDMLKNERRTIIFYESPHRIKDTLDDMLNILGNRKTAIARELTKHYEEIFRGNLENAREYFSEGVKGEFVIIVEGNKEEIKKEINVGGELKKYLNLGLSKKEAVKIVSEENDIPRNIVYKESLKL
ncbi:16S rRNA (cytidine(1402)-2'-O)-methyltransferase [Paratissierella segnis]|jgi:16S rRNA (cytidine1402-2'-O)-methyltransferase|uniref:Ribosomal RNA small subunit methyltransferase I n=1 Tax=Paratissierella segnis TaxID=2763679 RepID=A0A926IJC4_9FIRM|nr:16S rRNA (cytidine(1402)-2'-O)-methyltransferase [Paratissierella segnis]MBC8587281.1 16S rRNA (cytidine(1402)-2'-O)-methyltransferase [Paratissierella segnis]